MKVLERYTVPKEQLTTFVAEHIDSTLRINSCTETELEIGIEQEYTEPEYQMGILFNLAHREIATLEEQNAINYAISAIKTLIDMGVLNDDKG